MPVLACEPVFPLAQLMTASSLAGGVVLMNSVMWLLIAVAVKSVTFAFFEKRLSWTRSLLFMLVANVLSTVPGVFVAVCASSIGGVIFAIPVMFFLGWLTAPRLRLALNKPNAFWLSGGAASIGFTMFFFVSLWLFRATEMALGSHRFVTYWILQLLFVTIAVVAGLIISTVIEEFVVALLARKRAERTSFYRSVVRANYVTLALILLTAAIALLPERIKSPHFIASWLHEVVAS